MPSSHARGRALSNTGKDPLELSAEQLLTYYDGKRGLDGRAMHTNAVWATGIDVSVIGPVMTGGLLQRKRGQDPAFPRLLGERLCLDFANSVESPRHHPEEFLHTYADLARWGRHVGLITDTGLADLVSLAGRRDDKAAEVFAQAIELRSTITRIFRAIARGELPVFDDLDDLRQTYATAVTHARFSPGERSFAWSWDDISQLDWLLWPVAHSAVSLLTEGDLSRVKECPGADDCGWLFYDTSKNGSRRWCSMEGCGSRVKMRRLYARSRHSGAGTS